MAMALFYQKSHHERGKNRFRQKIQGFAQRSGGGRGRRIVVRPELVFQSFKKLLFSDIELTEIQYSITFHGEVNGPSNQRHNGVSIDIVEVL